MMMLSNDKSLLPMQFLEGYLGEREIKGEADNSRIIELQKIAVEKLNLYHRLDDSDEVAWCSLAVIAAVVETMPGLIPQLKKLSINALAKSWMAMAVEDGDIKQGDIVIFNRGSDLRYGHVGFCYEYLGGIVKVLGGNQNDSVSIAVRSAADVVGVVRLSDWLDDQNFVV